MRIVLLMYFVQGVNVYDIIKAQYLVGTKAAIKAIEARFQVKND